MYHSNCPTRIVLILLLLLFGPVAIAQNSPSLATLEARAKRGDFDTAFISSLMQKGNYYANKYKGSHQDADSTLHMAAYIAALSSKNHYQRGTGLSLLLQGKAYRVTGRHEEEKKVSLEALQLLSQYGLPEEHAQALIQLGGTYSNNAQDLPKKIELYTQGAEVYHQQHSTLSEAHILEFIADLCYLQKDFSQSLTLLNQALRLYQSVHYPRVHGVYALMGVVYAESEDYLKALQYNQLAVTTAEQVGDSSSLMPAIYNRLGINYFDVRAHNRAMLYYHKGLYAAQQQHDTAAIQNLLLNIAQCYQALGNYSKALDTLHLAENIIPVTDAADRMFFDILYLKIHLLMHNQAGALPYYNSLLHLYQANQISQADKQILRIALAQYLQATGQIQASSIYLQTFNQLQHLFPASLSRVSLYELYTSRVDSANGNMTSALWHYQQYKKLSDSLTTIANSRQIGQLQMAFETEKKDKDIALLQQKNSFQHTSLQHERIYRYVFIDIALLLLAFCVVLYKGYRMKKKTNATLETQQTAIHTQNELLKKLLGEKELLLKEIHHRVKNNLQIVISLLNIQSSYLDNEAAIAAINNSQHRMHAMSLIHQKLYQTSDLTTINMQWYFTELVAYMQASFNTQGKINFQLQIASVGLDVEQAVPLGLILNETVCNAIKYAFPANDKGTVSISFNASNHEYELTIADNGIGLPHQFDVHTHDSLGMSLIHGLSNQLGGHLEFYNNNGLTIHLRFAVGQPVQPPTLFS